jgi:tRNA pseudouridine38-40 synthase
MDTQKKFLIKIAYQGQAFAGWQTQHNGLAIQTLIEDKLKLFLKHPVSMTGSGRTDAGVHALGQTAHFITDSMLDEKTILYKLNQLLPSSVRILEIKRVDMDFHARFDVIKKTYRYQIFNEKIMSPFDMQTHWHIPYALNLDLMKQACNKLIGTHDFKAFAAKNTQGVASVDSVRHLEAFELLIEGPYIHFELTSKGFLYKMVRNLVGSVIEIGLEKKPLSIIDDALKTGNRSLLGATAPPEGLFLKEVIY